MKKLLGILIILICFSCNKDLPKIASILPNTPISKSDTIITQNPTQQKVGFIIDSNWFQNKFSGYWIETHNWNGGGDFNNDGLKDLVVMFATNSPANTLHQKDSSSRIVIGVFINHKTYFELDTNLVYSYLGGFGGVNISDINHDGYLDIYQMTAYWEGTQYPKPSYYNNSGWGGMDSYVFLNNRNKGFIKYTLPVGNDGGTITSIIYDNNKNGIDEVYPAGCLCYFEFNGNSFIKTNIVLDKTFQGVSYNMNVLTPKYGGKNVGVIYTSESVFGQTYFILKLEGSTLIPKIKFKPTQSVSGPAQEIYVEDLDKDGKFEYTIPMWISGNSNNTIPTLPYLMIVDEMGNDVSLKYMDEELTKTLTYDQINWIGAQWETGFIYHTFTDIDGDGIKEIFPASGVGYKKENDTYYYKFINGKYRLQFYHSGWLGDVHKSNPYKNYIPFVDEKNGVNVFLPVEYNLYDAIFKTF